ncbi:MAG: TOMM precursor leader peptide-binding protein [Pseudonocardiaceae bacterium]
MQLFQLQLLQHLELLLVQHQHLELWLINQHRGWCGLGPLVRTIPVHVDTNNSEKEVPRPMTTVEQNWPAPSLSGPAERGVTAAHLAEQIAAMLTPLVAERCGALDVAILGVPGFEDRVLMPVATARAAPRLAVRRYRNTLIVAATPGGEGPCPGCLDRRWTACRAPIERRSLDDPHGLLLSAVSAPGPHVVSITAALLAAATAPNSAEPPSYPVWEIAINSARVDRYGLIRDSSCPDCAAPLPDTAAGAERFLRPTPARSPGVTRASNPEDLHLPLEVLVNPVCGMLGGRALRTYHATATAPVSGFFQVRSKYGLHDMWWSGHAESYRRSELLGVLEGLERHAGQRPSGLEPAQWASAAELAVPFVEMEQCGLYPPGFYDAHHEKYVPWSDNPAVPWVWGWSLRDHRPLLVPEQLVYYLDHREDHRNTVQECSNGCASGSSVTEAALHGLLELLERDAFLISWYSGLPPTEIDLDTVAHPLVRQMRAQVELLGYDLRCFDLRVDLPVPAVGAVAVRRDGGLGTLCFAAGASLDPSDAVRAAVCEVASYVPGFPDRVDASRAQLELMVADYQHVGELQHHALLFGMPEMAEHAEPWLRQSHVTPLADVFADWTAGRELITDLRQPTQEIVELLGRRGFDTVVVDQTTPEQQALGLHTVAVLVPGLVPIDFGWTRQRALRMPRTLWAPYLGGRSTHPLSPDQLHLVPHPFP